MANVEKLSITLPKDMADAIRDALRGWRFKRISVDPSDTARIRRLVEEGMASGPSVDAEEVFDRLERKYAALAEKQGSGGNARL